MWLIPSHTLVLKITPTVTETYWQEVGCSEWTGNLSCTCVPGKANSSINKVCPSEHVTLLSAALCYSAINSTSLVYLLLFASLCYFLIIWLMIHNFLCMSVYFVFYFCILFCVFCDSVSFLYCSSLYAVSLLFFVQVYPTTATRWKPNCSK